MYSRSGIFIRFFPANSEEYKMTEHCLAELKKRFPKMTREQLGCDYVITFPSFQDAKAAEKWLEENS